MFFICSSSPEIYNSSPKYLGGVFLWYILSMTFIEEGIILSNENTQEENSKPKYNMLQNSWFMIKTAWQINEGKMIFLCLLSAVFALVTNVLNLYVVPVILGTVTKGADVRKLILIITAFTLCTMLVSAAAAYVKNNIVYVRATIRSAVLGMINKKAATTSYSNIINDRFKKDYDNACESVQKQRSSTEAIWTIFEGLITDIAGFVIYLSLLTSVQPVLFVIVLVTAVISYFAGNCSNRYSYKHYEEKAEYESHLRYILRTENELGAAKDIRIFGLRGWLEELYAKTMKAYIAYKSRKLNVLLCVTLLDVILTFIRNAAAYMYLIAMVVNEKIDVATFLLLFTAVGGFAQWITGILQEFNNLHLHSINISITREFLEYEEPFRFEDGEHLEVDTDKKYEIRLENVSFRYPGACKDTLTDINLTIHPGEKLAVVGLNGAGKTTLVRLVCGFLNPNKGKVLLNGKDIRDYDRKDYYMMFAAVFQEFALLPGSIAQNIAQTDEDIDMARVKSCAVKAGIAGKIEELPGGYETHLNRQVYEDAVMLSGGETQSLMLARALYKDAPFIVLDEPTAALDPIAESRMYEKYNELANGKSSIYISHRLASTRFCDRIIMLGNSGIIEEGTHEELLKKNGEYAKLYEIQSRYYTEEDNEDGQE